MNAGSSRVTIREIAQMSGVSRATVSRVLTGNPHVRAEVRARVQRALQEAGYQPNALARGLATGVSTVVGIVLPDIRNPFYAEIVRGFEDVAIQRQYAVFCCDTDRDPNREEAYLHALATHRVAGVVLTGAVSTAGALAARRMLRRPPSFSHRTELVHHRRVPARRRRPAGDPLRDGRSLWLLAVAGLGG
jgi:DNA-binding LacI/PurR family transcriptional regulator